MFRLLIATGLAYACYRIGREFIGRVPDDFEPLLLAPPAGSKQALEEGAMRREIRGRG